MKIKVEKVACDFCGKSQDDVERIFAGPNSAAICSECADDMGAALAGFRAKAPTPPGTTVTTTGMDGVEKIVKPAPSALERFRQVARDSRSMPVGIPDAAAATASLRVIADWLSSAERCVAVAQPVNLTEEVWAALRSFEVPRQPDECSLREFPESSYSASL